MPDRGTKVSRLETTPAYSNRRPRTWARASARLSRGAASRTRYAPARRFLRRASRRAQTTRQPAVHTRPGYGASAGRHAASRVARQRVHTLGVLGDVPGGYDSTVLGLHGGDGLTASSNDETGRLKLTRKQQRFVDEYLIDLSATQAAKRAGYSPRTARQQASRLLSNVNIQAAPPHAQVRRSNTRDVNNLKRVLEAPG